MAKQALMVWGGWDGHTPKECVEVFAPWLDEQGFDVTVSDTLEAFEDEELMSKQDLIVPIWTMGEITKERCGGLVKAVRGGAGLAGWHGGMCDAFRANCNYQFMTGGQWVAHPGGCIPEYTVNIVDRDDDVMKGLDDFEMKNTEQYYLHVDPVNQVLATTTFEFNGATVPQVWKRIWGEGRVFYSALGHTYKDFDIPECLTIQQRGMLWAAR